MPRIARRTRTTPDDVPELQPAPEEVVQAGDGEIDPDLPPQMRFFMRLRRIPPGEWDNHVVYMYRLEPQVRNSGPHSNIGIFRQPFDEEDIRRLHGGGKFQAILKNTQLDKAIAKQTIQLEGPAKLMHGQVLLDESGKEIPVAPVQAPSAAPSSSVHENVLADVLNKALAAIQQQKMPADDAIKSALDTLSQAQKGAMEIVMSAAKSQASSTTGHPLMDRMLERAMTKMVDGEETRRNPMEEFKTMLQTVRELQGLTGETAAPARRGGLLEEAKAVAELLKSDSDGTIKSIILGNRDVEAEPPSGWSQFFGFLGKALERRPDIIDHVANGLGRLTSMAAAPRPVVLPPAALLGTAAGTAVDVVTVGSSAPQATPGVADVNTVPAEPEQPQSQLSEQQVVEGILLAVVNGYRGNFDGEAVAKSIKVLYPQAVQLMRQYMGYPDALLMGFLRQQPVLAPIVNEPDFAEFFGAFKAEIMIDDVAEEDEGEDAPDQANGATAGN